MPDREEPIHSAMADASSVELKPNAGDAPRSYLHRILHLAMSSNGLLALCDQAVISLGNFLTGLVIGRLAGKNELGMYALCLTIVQITIDLSAALTTTPYTVFGPRLHGDERRRYIGNMFLLHCAISLVVATCILAGIGILTTAQTPEGLVRALWSTAAVITLINAREFVRRICFADLAIGMALVFDIVFSLVHFAGLYLIWQSDSLTASAVYVLLGAVAFFHTSAWFFFYRSKVGMSRDWWAEGPRNWHFAKWVLGSGLLWTIATYCYPWFLAAYHGTVSAGTWASCSAMIAVGNPVLGGLVNYLGPKLSTLYASSGLEAMKRYVYRSSILMVLILSPFALVLSLYGTRIMTALYGPAYDGTQSILILLSLNLLALSFSQPYSRGLFALQAAKADMLVNLIAVALLFGVGVMAVKYYSVTGAASALLLSTFATAIIRVAAFSKASSPPSQRPQAVPVG